MRNNHYTIGLLVASCLLMILALVFTWVEIFEYRRAEADPAARAPITRPAPAPAAPGEPAEPAAGE